MSSFEKDKTKKVVDVILATGCLIRGIVFIIFSTTSLTCYSAYHIFSI